MRKNVANHWEWGDTRSGSGQNFQKTAREHPRDAQGNPTPPGLMVNGQSYPMNAPLGNLDHEAGVEYHAWIELPEGYYDVAYETYDEWGNLISVNGYAQVKGPVVFGPELSGVPGSLPDGFSRMNVFGASVNHWHLVAGDNPLLPVEAWLGGKEYALWFADSEYGDYQDARGGIPGGRVVTGWVDLGLVEHPVLSFSSYYETQDLGPEFDVKRVLVQSGSGTSEVYRLSGYEDGYRAWRTVMVDLSDYQNQEVRVVFEFDARSQWNNDYPGWLISDIVIGNDADRDGIPDRVEEDLLHSKIYQAGIWGYEGNTAIAGIAREMGALSTNYNVRAVIEHDDPDELNVWVGFHREGQDHMVWGALLWEQGVARTACFNFRNLYFASPTMEEKTPDGLLLTADVSACVNQPLGWLPGMASFMEARDWYLVVEAPDGSSRPVIHSFQLVRSGYTDPLEADSNLDGLRDGEKMRLGLDPLSQDTAGDGLIDRLDPDPWYARTVNAFEVSAIDFREQVVFRFVAEDSVVTRIEFTGVYPGGQERVLREDRSAEGSVWTVTMAREGRSLPSQVRVDWWTAAGNIGTGTLVMGEELVGGSSVYRPLNVELVARDRSGKAFAGEFGLDWENEQGLGGILLVSAARTGSNPLARHPVIATGLFIAAAGVAVYSMDRVEISSGVLEAVSFSSGTRVENNGRSVQWGSEVGAGIVGLEAAISNGVMYHTADGSARVVYDDGARLIIGELTSAWYQRSYEMTIVREFNNSWDPGRVLLPSVDDVLALERIVAFYLFGMANAEVLKHMPVNSYVDVKQSGFDPFAVEIAVYARDGELDQELQSASLEVPRPIYDSMRRGIQASTISVPGFVDTQKIVDHTIGMLALNYNHQLANRNQFQGEIYWFWDDVPHDAEVDCAADPSTWPHPDIRRCADLKPMTKDRDLTWKSYTRQVHAPLPGTYLIGVLGGFTQTLQDSLTVSKAGWDGAQSMTFVDDFSAKGVITGWQLDISEGRDVIDFLADELQGPKSGSTGDAYVHSVYHLDRFQGVSLTTMNDLQGGV